jgi:hypothetical protein
MFCAIVNFIDGFHDGEMYLYENEILRFLKILVKIWISEEESILISTSQNVSYLNFDKVI